MPVKSPMANLNTSRRLTNGLIISAVLLQVGCSTTDKGASTAPTAVSGTPISGELIGTLSAGSSPYRVTGDLVVPAGNSLTIDPGVELRFDGLYMFQVEGKLEARGWPDANIVFTSGQGSLGGGDFGQWRGIVFGQNSDTSSILEYCQVKFGAVWDSTVRYPDSTGLWINSAIFLWNASPTISNCDVVMNGYHGIYCIGANSRPRIVNTLLYENDGDGIRCEALPGQAEKAQPDIWYTDSFENNTRQWAETPDGIGENVRINDNGDSCDFQYNLSVDPEFLDFLMQDYNLNSCSPGIAAGQDGLTLGSMPYTVAPTELRGNLGDRTVTAAGNPWRVTCDAFVNPGHELVIGPGSLLLFTGIYEIRIAGTLRADGATFITEDSTNAAMKWLGVYLQNGTTSDSYIRNCRFAHASTFFKSEPYGGVVTATGCQPDISHNTFENCDFAAVACLGLAAPTISYNIIDGFGPVGINCYNNSHPQIHHNIIRNGMGYGILCNFLASPLIQYNLITGNDLVGVKCSNQSSPIISYNTITLNDYSGVGCWGASNPALSENIVAFNGSPSKWADPDHGNAISVLAASFPTLEFNDLYQDTGSVFSNNFGELPDSTNKYEDPLFENIAGGDFHLQSGSPCLTAGPGNGPIGAYAQGDWP